MPEHENAHEDPRAPVEYLREWSTPVVQEIDVARDTKGGGGAAIGESAFYLPS
jgi:hypothetical protein